MAEKNFCSNLVNPQRALHTILSVVPLSFQLSLLY